MTYYELTEDIQDLNETKGVIKCKCCLGMVEAKFVDREEGDGDGYLQIKCKACDKILYYTED